MRAARCDERVDLGTDNAFAELGLASDATEIEVKAAWRRLVSQWHPDRNDSASASAKMQRINQAFEAIRRSRRAAGPGADPFDQTNNGDDRDSTAAPGTTGVDPRRAPIKRRAKLTLEEAAAGCIKVLRGKVTDACAACAGTGHRVLGGNCPRCKGSGAVLKRSWFGWPSERAECEACHGGGIARQPCHACDGSGKLATQRYQVKVRIPPGVRHGDLLHVDARRQGQGQPPADLEIRVELLAHAFFELDDDGTIRCEIPVDGFTWIANRSIQVPTLAGLQTMRLSRDRLSYCLEGLGFPVQRRASCADQLVTVVPLFPEQLGTDQEILLDQLIAASSGSGGTASGDRIQAWNRGLLAWERGLAGRRR